MDSVDRAFLRGLIERHGMAPASVEVHALGDEGPSATFSSGEVLYPASMIKTPLVAALLAEVEAGRYHLTDRFEVSHANMTFNDAPSPLVPGYWARIDEICELAISRSDNVATNMLFDLAGRERATQLVRERFGLKETRFARKLSGSDPLIKDPGWDGHSANMHPAHDAAHLFGMIAADGIPYAELIRNALAQQYWNDKLSRGLAHGDRFAHKTGDTSTVTHDGGILSTAAGRDYVIVVYTGLESNDANNAKFAPFMRSLRAYL